MPADTSLKVCQRALILMGDEPIISFTDGSASADVANAMYEDIARACLVNSRWRFATKQYELVRSPTAPTGRFDAAYLIPSDSLMVNAVTVNDYPIVYDIYENAILCDASTTDTLVLDYVYRVDEASWPSYFTLAVEYTMASVFATSIARDSGLSQILERKAQYQMMLARRLDSQQQTTRKLNTSRFIAQRRS